LNLGAALVLLKLAVDSGFTVSPKTGPTTPTGIPARPHCGVGREAIWNTMTKKWDCVVQFD